MSAETEAGYSTARAPSSYGDWTRTEAGGRFRAIVVDPPWPYNDRLGAARHYGLMTLDEIAAVPVAGWAEPDAHLYLWVTNAFMVEGHAAAAAWGFDVKTILTWVKPQIGMGHYFRNNTEHVLFAVRGSLATLRRDCPTAFRAPRGRHSEKPDAFFDLVESMSPGPYLSIFERRLRLGWRGLGDEVGGLTAPLGG
jgi:N6-adenosine-specific RNA methylase IME4